MLSGKLFEHFVRTIWEKLPGHVDAAALADSVRDLAGRAISREEMGETAWRMMGNLPRLKARRTVPPWHLQKMREWVPVQITACRRTLQGHKRGALFTFRILAGSCCPKIVQRFWSLAQCYYFAPDFGFSRPGKQARHLFAVPEQFVSLRAYVLVYPELSLDGPGFRELDWPGTIKTHNKEQIKRRFRVDEGYACPIGHPSRFPCHRCPVGYLQCAAATHRKKWVKKRCPECENAKAFFDPESASKMCVDCTSKRAYRP